MTCSTCRHAYLGDGPDHCRRFPPTALSDKNSSFPLVLRDLTFCGEHSRSIARTIKQWFTSRKNDTAEATKHN